MSTIVIAVGHPELPPLKMPQRFRHEVTYFMTPAGEHGVPPLAAGEYWIRLPDAQRCLEEGVISIVSPLDSETRAEIEISEEQEEWLEWMVKHRLEHIHVAHG